MILHFLYITCRKNSLFRGPGIEKAGRHTEKAAPGESAARIAEKTKRKNARRKAIGPLRSKVQATRRAVSYTHLDVYKRQVMSRAQAAENCMLRVCNTALSALTLLLLATAAAKMALRALIARVETQVAMALGASVQPFTSTTPSVSATVTGSELSHCIPGSRWLPAK